MHILADILIDTLVCVRLVVPSLRGDGRTAHFGVIASSSHLRESLLCHIAIALTLIVYKRISLRIQVCRCTQVIDVLHLHLLWVGCPRLIPGVGLGSNHAHYAYIFIISN